MKNRQIGKIKDYLSLDEVENSKKYAEILAKSGKWGAFLADDKIDKAINVTLNLSVTFDELNSIKSALFEVRFAYLIHQSGLTAEYEFNPNPNKNKKGQKQKSIDFKLCYASKNINLLIELSSLRESNIQKDKTWEAGKFVGCCLNGDDEVSEYFKAQKVLIEKAAKFSPEIIPNQYNIILLDMRSSILENLDCFDCRNILYGSEGLDPALQRHTKDNKLFPGIFCSTHPNEGDVVLDHLRKSIHYFGFVVEKQYMQDELATEIKWFKNPSYLDSSLPNLKETFGKRKYC
ncbi:MAG: hypothetical protein KAT71_03175 [Gammaproteobacteria bacterium]|nr:hypothetical protein [Gammaproteobacteria bacterium]